MPTSLNNSTFYFYDYETFGLNSALDRPAQFAGVRTDLAFKPISTPSMLYCKPSNDYLPTAEAVLLTGITPQKALKEGLPEYQFAHTIHQHFSAPNTCVIGYNNLRFDDEVTRYLFYRNFINPYAYSWQHNNSRWDLLNVTRACCALRPTGINWPINDHGHVSFKLEHLTQANNLSHEHAHDALSDVYATIAMAKLIHKQQPRLFNYLFELRKKNHVTQLLDIIKMPLLVHISGMFPAKNQRAAIVTPIAWHPTQTNTVIVCNLSQDLSPLVELTPNELHQRLYTKQSTFKQNELPVPLKLINISRCPVIAPLKVLHPEDWQRLQLDQQYCESNWKKLRNNAFIVEKIHQLFSIDTPFETTQDVDTLLYQRFFSRQDETIITQVATANEQQLMLQEFEFHDSRLSPLLFRYKARNFPHILTEQEQSRWLIHRQHKFNDHYLQNYLATLDFLVQEYQHVPEKLQLLRQLYHYCQWLLQ